MNTSSPGVEPNAKRSKFAVAYLHPHHTSYSTKTIVSTDGLPRARQVAGGLVAQKSFNLKTLWQYGGMPAGP